MPLPNIPLQAGPLHYLDLNQLGAPRSPTAFHPGSRFAATSSLVRDDVLAIVGGEAAASIASPRHIMAAILSACALFTEVNQDFLWSLGQRVPLKPLEEPFGGSDEWGTRLIKLATGVKDLDMDEPISDAFCIRFLAFVHGAMGRPGHFEFGGRGTSTFRDGVRADDLPVLANIARVREFLMEPPKEAPEEEPPDDALERLGTALGDIAQNPGPIKPPLGDVPYSLSKDGERIIMRLTGRCTELRTPGSVFSTSASARASIEIVLSDEHAGLLVDQIGQLRDHDTNYEKLGAALDELRLAARQMGEVLDPSTVPRVSAPVGVVRNRLSAAVEAVESLTARAVISSLKGGW